MNRCKGRTAKDAQCKMTFKNPNKEYCGFHKPQLRARRVRLTPQCEGINVHGHRCRRTSMIQSRNCLCAQHDPAYLRGTSTGVAATALQEADTSPLMSPMPSVIDD